MKCAWPCLNESYLSFRRSCFSRFAFTQHPRYVPSQQSQCSDFWSHTPRLTDGFFNVRERIRTFHQRLVLDYASMLMAEHTCTSCICWRYGKTCLSVFPIRHFLRINRCKSLPLCELNSAGGQGIGRPDHFNLRDPAHSAKAAGGGKQTEAVSLS